MNDLTVADIVRLALNYCDVLYYGKEKLPEKEKLQIKSYKKQLTEILTDLIETSRDEV